MPWCWKNQENVLIRPWRPVCSCLSSSLCWVSESLQHPLAYRSISLLLPPGCVSVSEFSPCHKKDPSHVGQGIPPCKTKPFILTSSICNKTLSKSSHIFEVRGRMSTYRFGDDLVCSRCHVLSPWDSYVLSTTNWNKSIIINYTAWFYIRLPKPMALVIGMCLW